MSADPTTTAAPVDAAPVDAVPPPHKESPLVFAFALVPVCDLLAGYFNFDTWSGVQSTDATTDPYLATITSHWSNVYLSEFIFGAVGAAALGTHIAGIAPPIVFNVLAKVHILVDAVLLYYISHYVSGNEGSQDLITPTNSSRNTEILHGLAIAGAVTANVGLMMKPKEAPPAPVTEEPTDAAACDPYYESCL